MDTCISSVNLMSYPVQLLVLTEAWGEPVEDGLTDMEVRLLTIKTLFNASCVDNLIMLTTTEKQYDEVENAIDEFLKEWDEL